MAHQEDSDRSVGAALFLFRGGPFYLLQQALGFIGPRGDVRARRAPVLVLIAWLPLVVLGALQGRAVGPTPGESVLLDLAVAVRFLVALPLLLLAENLADQGVIRVAKQFVDGGLIKARDGEALDLAAARALRMRDSWLAEAVMLGIAVLASTAFLQGELGSGEPSWRSIGAGEARSLSLAGWWAMLASAPLFVFVLLRWLWRLVMWTVLLWRIATLDLAIAAGHPDGAGGLGFLSLAPLPFLTVVFALSVALAGAWGTAYLHRGVDPRVHLGALAIFVGLAALLLLIPVFAFLWPLARARRAALLGYQALGSGLARSFEARWVDEPASDAARLLESPDASALADFTAVFGTVRNMNALPLGLPTLVGVAVAAGLPMLPLVAAVVPLPSLLGQLAKALL
jgi:hypothetical protein